jgi:transglutaminase-like putative cysteine protease
MSSKKEYSKKTDERSADDLHDEIVDEVIQETSKLSSNDSKENYPLTRSLMLVIGTFFLITLFFFWALPDSAIRIDPEPKDIPKLNEFIPAKIALPASTNITRPNEKNILNFIMPTEPIVKEIATKIAVDSCNPNTEAVDVCRAKALFYFVRDNFAYISETDEYFQIPIEMFYSKGGDCDDFSIMLASLEEAIGIPTRLVIAPNHVYIQIYLIEANKRYKEKDGWINLDPTCSSCEFGQSPVIYKDASKQILWLS